jgi:hypothetical protein
VSQKTSLGYRTFRCGACPRRFNERSGTPFNHLQFPTDIVLLMVLWRLRYKLSLRDLAEMFLVRGFEFTHEAVRDWEARFAPLITAPTTRQAPRHGWSVVVCRRDVHQGRGRVARPVSRECSRRQLGRLSAQ